MRASMRAGWMAPTMASICGFFCCAAQGSAVTTSASKALVLMRARRLGAERSRAVRLGTQLAVECIEISVDDGDHHEGQQGRSDDAADDGAAHRRLLLRAFAEA